MLENAVKGQPRYPDLAGKVAVVTGGSRGIGAATAHALAANGATVAVVARDEQALAAVIDSIRAGGRRAIAVRADCTVEHEVGRAGDPRQLPRALGGRERPDASMDDRGAARAAGRRVPAATNRPAR
jgi:NAD(P)-dependent dehydrogenase (short-subunit alcohol dehydrogenase family)